MIIAGFTTIVQMLVKAYLPAIDQALGIYLPLIVVNCIILGRAEAFASKNPVGLSALDGLGMGAGFTAALVVMGGIREFLGNGTLFGWPEGGLIPPHHHLYPARGRLLRFRHAHLADQPPVEKTGGRRQPERAVRSGMRRLRRRGCPHAAACALAANDAADPEKPGVEEEADQ